MDAAAEDRIAGRDAGVENGLRSDDSNGALQANLEPVDRHVEPTQELRLEHQANGSCRRVFGSELRVAAANAVIALVLVGLSRDLPILRGRDSARLTLLECCGRHESCARIGVEIVSKWKREQLLHIGRAHCPLVACADPESAYDRKVRSHFPA